MHLDPNYVSWLADAEHIYEHPEYLWIVETLATIPFHWTLWLDENANAHGLECRSMYYRTTGMFASPEIMESNQASLLEVMIACAATNEYVGHYDPDFDGTYRWFWQEMHNIGFTSCRNEAEVYSLAEVLLSRNYGSDGSGSMTGPLENPKEDIRNMPFMQQIQVWDMHTFR